MNIRSGCFVCFDFCFLQKRPGPGSLVHERSCPTASPMAFHTENKKRIIKFKKLSLLVTLRIIGPSYRGVWLCIAGFWDLQTTSFEIPWFLGQSQFCPLEVSERVSIWCIFKNIWITYTRTPNWLFSMSEINFAKAKNLQDRPKKC